MKIVARVHAPGTTFTLGIVERSNAPNSPYPYHVTIHTYAGPQYLGACATLAEAKRAIRENT